MLVEGERLTNTPRHWVLALRSRRNRTDIPDQQGFSKEIHFIEFPSYVAIGKAASMILDNNILKSDFDDVDVTELRLHHLLLDRLHKNLATLGDGPWMTDYSTKKTIRYSQVIPRVETIAANLRKHGFQQGDFLLFCCGNHIDFALTQLAVLCVGGGITSISPSSLVSDIADRCKDASARFLICDEQTAGKAKEAAELHGDLQLFSFDTIDGFVPICQEDNSRNLEVDLLNESQVDLDTAILILYSSGTTGRPKGIVHTHRTISSMLQVWEGLMARTSGDQPVSGRVKIFINYMIHIGGTGFNFLSFLSHEHNIILSKYTDEELLHAMADTKASVVSIFPPQIAYIVKHSHLEQFDLSHVEAILTGGSTMNPDFCDLLRQKLKNLRMVSMGYGMTEVGVVSVYLPDPITGVEKRGSCGKLAPCCTLKIEDVDTGENLPAGVVGEVCVQNPFLLTGYHKHPEATAEFLRGGWAHTGDLGHYDEDGFIYVTGRIKELIKYRMQHVVPAEVESHLLNHPAVQDAVLVGKPDDVCGELPTAFIVVKDDCTVTEEEIIKFIDERVPDEARLRGGVRFVKQIPRNDSGKPVRRYLVSQL